jgi:hypothetical protein
MPIVASVGHRVHYKLLNPLLRLVLYMVLTFHPPPCAAWLLCLLLFFLPVVFLFYIFLHLALLFIIVPPLQLAVHLHVG